jgi:cytochrome oxidase Cu insertion factor (SCO1/SenC/PrrC family)
MSMPDQIEPVGVGALAPDAALRDENGQETRLSTFWQQQPTAIVFVRHFG